MARVILLAVVLYFAFSSGYVTDSQSCLDDGYYYCDTPVFNFETPSSSATKYTNGNFYGITGNLPFPHTPWNHIAFDTYGIQNFWISFNHPQGYGYFDGAFGVGANYRSTSSISYEVLGSAPERRVVWTFEDIGGGTADTSSASNYVQIKIFENGNLETHIKSFKGTPASKWQSGVYLNTPGYVTEQYPIANNASFLQNVAWGLYIDPTFVPPTCGNGVVDPGEDCEDGDCCADCFFTTPDYECRPSYGTCDVAEFCTGESNMCPDDTYAAEGTVCGQSFGVCDLTIDVTCDGATPYCAAVPMDEISAYNVINFDAFHVISFDEINGNTGSIGGRAAARRDVNFVGSGFSVGSEIVLTPAVTPEEQAAARVASWSLVSGQDVNWVNGELYPDANSLRMEGMFAGTSFTGPSFLGYRVTGTVNAFGGLDGFFDMAEAYYISVSNTLASLESNVDVSTQWSGLFFSCASAPADATRYVANVDPYQLDSSTWYSIDETCNYGASWVINVFGGDNVNFQGGDFPGIGERIVFNSVGGGRNVIVQSGVNGNILAPQDTFIQNGGVTHGLIIAGTINSISSASLPDCAQLAPFDIVVPASNNVNNGANEIAVPTFNAFVVGDVLRVGGQSLTITERKQDSDGNRFIVVSPAVSTGFDAGTFLSTTVENPAAAREQTPITQIPAENPSSSAAVAAVSAVVIMIAALI